MEADFVAGDGIGHLTFLLIGPVSKIAVNTRGGNEARSILFPPSNMRGMTPKPIGRRHVKSCSRHAATRNTQTGVASFTDGTGIGRSEEHTSELQSHVNLVCRLLLE